jgi:hypothetical protein
MVIQKDIALIVKAKKEQVLPLRAMSMLFTEHNTSVPITTSMELSSAGKASATYIEQRIKCISYTNRKMQLMMQTDNIIPLF